MMTSSGDDTRPTPLSRVRHRGTPAEDDLETDVSTSTIRTVGLTVSRGGPPVLHDISVAITRGSVVGLLGPSGCGKTTLMRAVVGVQKIGEGSVTVLGRPAGDRRLRGRIGYVTQQLSIYPDLSVRDNVSYFASLAGVSREQIAAAIDDVDLAKLTRRRVNTLSGGQASRVSLACALVGDPEVLVLDEPTVGLDPLTREDLWEKFRSLARAGRTLLVSSHVMDEALRCDRLILMREGRILASMTPGELMERTGEDSPDRAFLALISRDQEEVSR